jgi:hypothetical protein
VAEPAVDTQPHGITEEAERLAALVVAGGLPLRLMGGLAIWLRCPTVRLPPYRRTYDDLDFVARSAQSRLITGFFGDQGYVPEKLFNALHGASRLNFKAVHGRWTIDVIFDVFQMSHRIDLRGRLADPTGTLDLADLLLTKLQVWEVNRKDLGDAACLLADHAIDPSVPDAIDIGRVLAVTTADWGLCHTVERNLERVAARWRAEPGQGARYDAASNAEALLRAIHEAPKALAWKARARVGERVRWYETPEDVRH